MIELLHGDCLELMKDIPDNSIDCCLTDPPYGTTACRWDNVIDFELMWAQLKRIVKDNRAICLFGSEPFSSRLRLSNIKMFKYDWIWQKNICNGFVNAKLKPLRIIENVIIFSNGKTSNKSINNMVYLPQGLIEINKKVTDRRAGSDMRDRKENSAVQPSWVRNRIQKYTNYPKELIKFKSEHRVVHPTQKPVKLLEYLIKTYTLENETVLDFTFGSGSTAIACLNTNRKFIGIEKDETYFNIAKERIEKHNIK